MLIDSLKEIIDTKNVDLAFHEAQNKLSNTVVKVSYGNLYQNKKLIIRTFLDLNSIEFINYDGNRFILKENNLTKIDIKIWLPETGVYFNQNKDPFVFYKKPRRQWKKSFSNENYDIESLNGLSLIDYNQIIDDSHSEIWIYDKKKLLMYYGKKIGKIENNKIICTNMLFKQEIKDWIKKM